MSSRDQDGTARDLIAPAPELQGAITESSRRPGKQISAQKRKKPDHPSFSARIPVVAPNKTLGTPMRLESKAYCVAVKRLFVTLAMYPAYAEVPIPAVKVSR